MSASSHASDGLAAGDSPPRIGRVTPEFLALASRHPLLESLPAAGLQRLVANCTVHQFAGGEVVLQAGGPNNTFYLVLAGQLHAILDPTRPANRVCIAAGECFGEMSVIEQMPVSATVVAGQDACLLAVPEAAFWSALASERGLARSLLRALSERMRRRSELVIKGARERLELEAVQRELALAREVQISMLADGDSLLAEHPGIDVVAAMTPAQAVGGDFYDAFAIDARRVFVAVGDVAGKGISAAMFMARSLATLRMEVLSGLPYDTLISRFNRGLCEHNAHTASLTALARARLTKQLLGMFAAVMLGTSALAEMTAEDYEAGARRLSPAELARERARVEAERIAAEELERDREARSVEAQRQLEAQRAARPAGERLVAARCGPCHGLDALAAHAHGRSGWWLTVLRMQWLNGASIEPGETAVIVEHLVRMQPAAPSRVWMEWGW